MSRKKELWMGLDGPSADMGGDVMTSEQLPMVLGATVCRAFAHLSGPECFTYLLESLQFSTDPASAKLCGSFLVYIPPTPGPHPGLDFPGRSSRVAL